MKTILRVATLVCSSYLLLSCGGSQNKQQTLTPPPATNTFAYLAGTCCSFDLKLLKSDGSTTLVATDKFASAILSHDGQKIAFSLGGPMAPNQVGIMNPDGSGRTMLTTTGGYYPQFTPDDTKIIYESEGSPENDIHVMNADGTGDVAITSSNPPTIYCQSTVSLDGKTVAAAIQTSGFLGIATMNIDGTGLQRIFSSNSAYTPAFNSDGSEIVFSNGNIWTMTTQGTNAVQISNGSLDFAPVLVGKKIYFAHGTQVPNTSEIYSMNSDGSALTQLTNEPVWAGPMISVACRP